MIDKLYQPHVTGSLSMGYSDYLKFSEFVLQRFGLNFPEKRRTELEIGVRRAFSTSTCANLDDYFQLLQDSQHGSLELERLVNALTIGETHFFRDAGQFDALINQILPEIIDRRKSVRSLRLWSAGCASGEEPYSLAMLLTNMLVNPADWSITILATDINTHHLDRAKRGVYGEWAFRENRAHEMRERYFKPVGNKQYELAPEIRKMVTFASLNLAGDSFPSYSNNTTYMDIILCRNVTIYFPEEVTRQVVDRFYESLVDDGWLVVGHSEHSINTYQRFHTVNFPDAILYQRRAVPPLLKNWPESAPPPPFTNINITPLPVETSPKHTPKEFVAGKPGGAGAASSPKGAQIKPVQPVQSGQVSAESITPLEQAQALVNQGLMNEASDVLLHFLTQEPSNSSACALLGKIYAGLGKYIEAERWCQLAIMVDKLCLDAYYTLALVYEHQDLPQQAIEMMKRVIYIDRTDILGYFSLAGIYHNRGQIPLALKALENARRLVGAHKPEDIVPRSDGITMLRLGQAILQQQRQWAVESMRHAPSVQEK